MTLSPIGTFITRMDAALAGSIDGIIAAMTTAVATPIALAAVVFYAVQGLKLANGDPEPLHGFVRAGLVRGMLEVTAQNGAAIRLYRRLGFRFRKTLYKAVERAPALQEAAHFEF